MSTSDTPLDETIVQSTEGKRLALVVGVNNSSIIRPIGQRLSMQRLMPKRCPIFSNDLRANLSW